MKNIYLISAAIALGSVTTAAGAQAVVDPATPKTAPVTPAAPAPADAAAPTAVPAAQLVDREFGAYDLDKDGQLSSAEFATWVGKLRAPAPAGAAAQDPAQFSASLFARADTDHNQQVSKTEMTTLLSAAQG